MAELADALASGASGRKVVEVRVLSWAPSFQLLTSLRLFRLLSCPQTVPVLSKLCSQSISRAPERVLQELPVSSLRGDVLVSLVCQLCVVRVLRAQRSGLAAGSSQRSERTSAHQTKKQRIKATLRARRGV